MEKTVLTIDLNPLSRTSQVSDVSIVDDVVRALPNIIEYIKRVREEGITKDTMRNEIDNFDNNMNLKAVLERIKNMK